LTCGLKYNRRVVREVTYRLIVVRPNGTRELIAVGIPATMAIAMQQCLGSQELASTLLVEPERRADGL
jgi:hypothetical protein